MLVVIVALRRDRPAHRLRARLRALAGLPGRRPVPEDGLPLVRSSSRTGSSRRSRSSAPSPPGSPRSGRPALKRWVTLGRRRRVLRHARCRRRSARSPSTTSSTRGSSASHLLLSMVVLALGVLVALEAWNVRGDPVPRGAPRARRRSPAPPAALLLVSGVLATAAGPHSGSDEGAARLAVRAGGLRPRPRDRGLRPDVPRPAHVARLPRQRPSPRRA